MCYQYNTYSADATCLFCADICDNASVVFYSQMNDRLARLELFFFFFKELNLFRWGIYKLFLENFQEL